MNENSPGVGSLKVMPQGEHCLPLEKDQFFADSESINLIVPLPKRNAVSIASFNRAMFLDPLMILILY